MRAMVLTADGRLDTYDNLLTIRRDADTDEYVFVPADEWSESVRIAGTLVTAEAARHEALAVELATDGRLDTPTTPRDADPDDYDFGFPEVRHEAGATYLLNAAALVHDAYWAQYADRAHGTGFSDVPEDIQRVRECLQGEAPAYIGSFNSAWGSGRLDGVPTRLAVYTESPQSDGRIEPDASSYDRVAFALDE